MDSVDFKELMKDENFMNKIKQFDASTEQIEEFLKHFDDDDFYENLSNADKIKFNLLMSFCLNSLFWMHLRAEGVNPNEHQIKAENDRLRKAMARAKQIADRSSMPRVNVDAAKRFVRGGLWTAKDKNPKEQTEGIQEDNWES